MSDDWRDDPLWYGWSFVSQVAYRLVLALVSAPIIYLIMAMKGITL